MKFLIAVAALAGLYACASTAAFTDAMQNYRHYCHMTEIGAWPDYKHLECNHD